MCYAMLVIIFLIGKLLAYITQDVKNKNAYDLFQVTVSSSDLWGKQEIQLIAFPTLYDN